MSRIALVEFSPSGGLFQFAVQLGEALAGQGHEVTLYTGPRPELATHQPGFTIAAVLPTWHPLDVRQRGRLLRKARRLVRAGQLVLAWLVLLTRLRLQHPDAVFFSTWRFGVDALGVLALDRLLPQTLLSIVSHEPRPMRASDTTRMRRGPVLDRALPAAWLRMDVIFVLGEETRRVLIETWHPTAPVHVIPHGDEAALRGAATLPAVAQTAPAALFFGLWTKYKGIDVLLQAWPRVRAAVPDAVLVIAGAPGEMDPEEVLRPSRAVGGVDVRPGYVDRGDIPALFGAARVVVTPYVRASQSGVAHLAFTFDRPVVATTVGDIPTVVHDGVSGVLVPPRDADALADALVALLSDPERAARLGEAGGQWLRREASWETVATRVTEGLAAAAGGRSQPRSTST